MSIGGGLNSHDVYKKVLSIGFEFETHDLAKLSLHQNGKTLINSDISLREIKKRAETGDVKSVGDNYISVKIPVKLDNSKTGAGEEDVTMNELQKEFLDQFEDVETSPGETKFLEYLNENRQKDNKETTKFQDTNDIGDVEFGDMLEAECEDLDIPKNEMYYFKSNTGKIFDIKFSESMDLCKTFSGLEFVVTYYKPKQKNSNIIVDTFVDACSRILDHFSNLKKINGSLLIKKGKNEFKTIGELKGNRKLYNKPGTNLFYMDTYDSESWWEQGHGTRTPNGARFIPQMTFKSKAIDTLDIIKELVNKDNRYKVGKSAIKYHETEYNDVINVEKIVDKLISAFNNSSSRKISSSNGMGKTLKFYLFFLFYKLSRYIESHAKILSGGDYYLKDFLSFSSRHTNYTLYARIKEIMAKHYDVVSTKELVDFFYQPEILKEMYELSISSESDYENGKFKYEDAELIDLPKRSKNYGDPMYSILSYFKYFEDPVTKKKGDRDYETSNDWFVDSGIDVYSTTFELKNDEVLLENRYFRFEIGLWLRNNVSRDIHTDELSVREMYMLVNSLYGKNSKNMMNLELDPKSHKLTKKCKEGFKRNRSFECVKTKKTPKTKKTKTVKRAKVIKSRSMAETMMA
jgi:hypothetical protein